MLTYEERAQLCQHPVAIRLLQLMAKKHTNLAVSLDVTTQHRLLSLAEALGPHICMLKIHVDILEDFDAHFIPQLRACAQQHEFVIFEDRKFADIGHTVAHQYQGGLYRIADWADVVTVHPVPGPGIFQGLKAIGVPRNRAALALIEMSSEGSLTDPHYQKAALELAQAHPDFVIGVIAQQAALNNPSFIHCTPGVHYEHDGDALGQSYVTPQHAIQEQGSDIIIVGRGIYAAEDPLAAAIRYREAGWRAYQQKGDL